MARIGNLTVDLTLKSAAFIRDLAKSSDAVAKNTKKMQASVSTLAKGFGVLFSARVVRQIAGITAESLKLAASMHGPLADSATKFLSQFEELQDSFEVGIATGFLDEMNRGLGDTEANLKKASAAGKMFGTTVGVIAKGTGFVFGTLIPDVMGVADRAIQKLLDKLDRYRQQTQQLSVTGMETRLGITDEDTDTVLAYGNAMEIAAMAQESFWSASVNEEAVELGERFLAQTQAEINVLNDAAGPMRQYENALLKIEAAHLQGEAATIAHQQAVAGLVGNYLQLADNIGTALGTMFKESKAVAVVQAVINTAQAITKTFAEYGATPWGFALAASMAAIGAAQIASILSAQPGSSKATKPSKGGATSATARAGSASRGGSFSQAVTINIVGDVFGPEHFRKIAAGLNDVQRDGTALLRVA